MTPDEIRFRRCTENGCDYKEVRGTRQGAFWSGRFVCDDCYDRHAAGKVDEQGGGNTQKCAEKPQW